MTAQRTYLLLACLALPCSSITAEPPPPSAQPASSADATSLADQLISQLSSEDWQVRRRVQRELAAMGEAAEPPLHRYLKEGRPDAEGRNAAKSVLAQIERARRMLPTTVTITGQSMSPRQAFEQVAVQAHLRITAGSEAILRLGDARPLAISFQKVPLWQAVEELCRLSGTVFESVEPDSTLTLAPAADLPAAPAATVGPFLATISRIELSLNKASDFAGRRPLNARGEEFRKPPLRLYLFAWSEPRLRARHWFVDSVDECVTDTGQRLSAARKDPPIPSGRVNAHDETQLELEPYPSGARRLAKLRVTARFVMERQTQKLEIHDALTVHNGTYLLGGFRLVLKEVKKVTKDRYAYDLSVFRDQHTPEEWQGFTTLLADASRQLLDAKGKALSFCVGGGRCGPNEWTISNTLTTDGPTFDTGEPQTLVWEYPLEVEQRRVQFVFEDVPLP